MEPSSSSDGGAERRPRTRRQEIVADLSDQALEATDVDQLLRDAATAVTRALETDYCDVLESLPEGNEFVRRAGVGWPDRLVGAATVAADRESRARETLRSETPIVVDEYRSDDRSVPEWLADRGVDSGIGVVIGSTDDPWGILRTHATDSREFADRDAACLRTVANLLAAAIDRIEPTHRERERQRVIRALEAAREGISVLGEDGEFVYVNDAYAEIFRYEREEMLGEHWDDLGIESDPDRFYDDILPRIADEGQWSGTTTCVRSDGSTFCSQHSLTHTDDDELICLVRDVTEQRERERTLRETEAQLELATEAASVGLWTWDLRTDAVTADEFLASSYGIDPDAAAAGAPSEIFYEAIHEDDRERTCERFAEAIEKTGELEAEYRVRDAGGDVMWVVARGEVEYDDGEPVRLNGAIADITERKRRERQLEKSNERLEQFAYAASHDLQEPLRMVSSYLQLLEDRYGGDLDAEGREFLSFAVDGADRMREMIDGLLAYSRVETRGDPFEPVTLDDVVADVCDDLRMKIEEHDAEITLEDLPRVEGDREQLRQLFQNLLDNAIEYSGDEPPRIHVRAERRSATGDRWRLSVRDEGIGIDPDDTDQIFEVFERLHSRAEHRGTGIGLALCQRIVERHGGEITVDSEPGEGSTFTWTLPAADPEQ